MIINATALNYILELGNSVAARYYRKRLAALDKLQRLGINGVTYNTCLAYVAAPREMWAPFGLHRLRKTRLRNALLGIFSWMPWLIYMMYGHLVHQLFQYYLTPDRCSPHTDQTVNATML